MKSIIALFFICLSAIAFADTPVCVPDGSSIDVDVAVVLYPFDASCDASAHLLTPTSLWYGYKYGVCTPLDPCATSYCPALKDCGSKGLTVTQYNQCYQQYISCPAPTTFVQIYPINQYTLLGNLFSDPLCSSPKNNSFNQSAVQFALDSCAPSFMPCGYNTTTWIRINKCSPATTSAAQTTVVPTNGAGAMQAIVSLLF